MNNQNYNQQPYQQPYQQPMQQPMQPMQQQPMQPKAPKKGGLFGGDMLAILACAGSILGFALVILGAIVASTGPIQYERTIYNFGTYGTILTIVGMLFSAGGCFLSFIFGNNNIKAGKPRGTAATLGLIFGLVGTLLAMFAVFFAGCSACVGCKYMDALK